MGEKLKVKFSSEITCPYCDAKFRVDDLSYFAENSRQKCNCCGRYFYFHLSFEFFTNTIRDCEINGENHVFNYTISGGKESVSCINCDFKSSDRKYIDQYKKQIGEV